MPDNDFATERGDDNPRGFDTKQQVHRDDTGDGGGTDETLGQIRRMRKERVARGEGPQGRPKQLAVFNDSGVVEYHDADSAEARELRDRVERSKLPEVDYSGQGAR